MTIIVEDGTVVAGAESYITVADANSYHSKRGNTAWEALDDVDAKEPALRKATDYMLANYRKRWKGYRKDAAQTLDWPRSFVYLEEHVIGVVGPYPYLLSDTLVPVEVKNACAELALKSISGELDPDLSRAKSSVTVGPISTTYDDASSEAPRYRAVDGMLAVYLEGTSFNAKLIR